MIDWLWIIALLSLTIYLTVRHIIDSRHLTATLEARNAQKVFHMSMQLPDRLKMDLS